MKQGVAAITTEEDGRMIATIESDTIATIGHMEGIMLDAIRCCPHSKLRINSGAFQHLFYCEPDANTNVTTSGGFTIVENIGEGMLVLGRYLNSEIYGHFETKWTCDY